MIVNMGVWLSTNWKALSVASAVVIGGGKATHQYVNSVEHRFDALEQTTSDLSRQGLITQCMIIQHDIGGEPLVCLEASE
jgi:hypothetical protein